MPVTQEYCARCNHKASEHSSYGRCGQPAKRGVCKCPKAAVGVAPYSYSQEYTAAIAKYDAVGRRES
jgi:hypothetical protein